MRIALLGYGKMGREIEQVALQRGHTITFIADLKNSDYSFEELKKAEVAIEFTSPEAAVGNILKCFNAGVPVVVGTTGWYEKLDEVKKMCLQHKQALFCATNFSIGVNVFFEINRKLAELMNTQAEYKVNMEEIHHTEKLDAPSGTAITLANDIISSMERKKRWISVMKKEGEKVSGGESEKEIEDALEIVSIRRDKVSGTHSIHYNSEIDSIEIIHTAKSRKGFATGAVMAAEWLIGRNGVFGMKDMLGYEC